MSDLDRFWAKVNKTDYCWEWTAAKKPSGYGNFWLNGKYINAHKYSAIIHGILTEPDLHVLHTCDNKSCVNPKHLYQGTNGQNVQDAIDRNRYNPWRRNMEVCDRGHQQTSENVVVAYGRNRCKICRWMRDAADRYRKNGRISKQTVDRLAELGYTINTLIEELARSPYSRS